MADVHEAQGIKLFGTTIAVKDIHEKHHEPTKSDQPTEHKRPEKIIPCPRCKSMETKFCYFNNYNVNQPRHFCKGCQRYWTAGGALRNVPVGAGRRKNKPPCQGFSESCFFDIGCGVQEIDFDGGVEGWQVAVQDGFHHVFPAKRRRSTTAGGGQSC